MNGRELMRGAKLARGTVFRHPVDFHPLQKHQFELLLAAFGGPQDLARPKEIQDCEMLHLRPHEDIGRAQFDFLSGNRPLLDLPGAKHGRKW